MLDLSVAYVLPDDIALMVSEKARKKHKLEVEIVKKFEADKHAREQAIHDKIKAK